MSIRAMTAVWDHSAAEGPMLLALLAIADVVNDETWEGWVGMATIARRMRRGERAAERAVASLVSMGEIEIVGRHGKSRVNIYRILTGRARHGAAQGQSGPSEEGPERPSEDVGPVRNNGVNPSEMTGSGGPPTRQKRRGQPVRNDGGNPSIMTGAYIETHPYPSSSTPSRGENETGKDGDRSRRWCVLGEALGLDPSRSPADFNKLRKVAECWAGFDLDRVVLPALEEGRTALERQGKDARPGEVGWKYFDPIVRRRGEQDAADMRAQRLTAGMSGEAQKRMRAVASYLRTGLWSGNCAPPAEDEISAVRRRYADAGLEKLIEARHAAE
ncbi:MAG: hypothetical protein R8L07_03520 [Alphaproteobacteria bacterium]|nr:hypothetical protein [Alphaproteobacteria bacterium]